jgi:hypothetical protein
MLKKNRWLLYFMVLMLIGLTSMIFISGKFQQVGYIQRIAHEKYSHKDLLHQVDYRLYMMNIPMGYLTLSVEDASDENLDVHRARLSLRPLQFLKTISFNNIGLDFTTLVDKKTLLPYRFEQNNVYYIKKGKKPKEIVYHHDDLLIQRKGRNEDIQDDTRDPVSLILWLMFQDYENTQLIKTTLNISRRIYLVVGKVEAIRDQAGNPYQAKRVKLKLRILQLNKEFKEVNSFSAMVYLLKKDTYYLPVSFDIRKKYLQLSVALK